MPFAPEIQDQDVDTILSAMAALPETESVAHFVPGPGIRKLDLTFDIDKLRTALDECLARENFMGGMQDAGFAANRESRSEH